MQVIKQSQVQEKIIDIRKQQVIIDADVAELYGVFPEEYIISLKKQEKEEVVTICDHLQSLKFPLNLPD